MKKALLSFMMVSILFLSCSEEGIETNAPDISDADKTVSIILANIPEGFLGENVYLFTINSSDEVYALEGAEALEDAIINVLPPSGNAPFDIVVFIPSDAGWQPVDKFVDGNYSIIASATDRLAVYITTTWEDVEDRASSTNSGVETTILVELSLDGDTEPIDTEYNQGDLITLNASVTDNIQSSVSNISYTLDGVNITSYTQEPYSFVFNTIDIASGEHVITVIATNAEGHTAEDEIDIKVVSTVNRAPTVTIISHSNNQEIIHQTLQNITASVSDPDNDVTKVEFRINDDLVETLTDQPYTYEWNTLDNSVGSVTITVTATDATGSTRSDVINVTLVAPANYNPVVSITSPANESTFSAGAIITIDASASDVENDLLRVDFYFGGLFLGSDDTSPFTIDFDTTGLLGAYTVSATAYDGNFNSSTDNITVNIN